MEITWLGHSSFLVEDSKGRKVLMDPFDESVGYPIFQGEVDIVTISHYHFDHSYTEKVKFNHIADKAGFFYLCDIPVAGIPSYHDKMQGAKRGENMIFIIEMDGYRICHLGDLGYILSEDEVKSLGKIDVLLIPIGGNYTINGKEASELAKHIDSHIIIPMHYSTAALSFQLDGLEDFLTHMKNGEKIGLNKLSINEKLIGENQVKILNYK
ncbi:MBL fold metallo-hydrolase [Clostridiaceae bacterium UIB06]|uniref:MBL fold metallo-hydrolase n=1 Tax=Clostridium thailandense TaxID=2794346 RepID=A0A949X226_9CLOT|nr:MBL fold metallo-hydrolase [Clostridium thailandense]MBV7272719.1 MBL fold metallo-hydrolase [Clostridium thailandense]MCH5135885.1 MBL fold metallo-hydrolase [Clostridiaceae bacterium UIB06]